MTIGGSRLRVPVIASAVILVAALVASIALVTAVSVHGGVRAYVEVNGIMLNVTSRELLLEFRSTRDCLVVIKGLRINGDEVELEQPVMLSLARGEPKVVRFNVDLPNLKAGRLYVVEVDVEVVAGEAVIEKTIRTAVLGLG